jgi:hypothetical protein
MVAGGRQAVAAERADGHPPAATLHTVANGTDTVFTWDYAGGPGGLAPLYERAKASQWNAGTDLPWDIEVDQEAVVRANAAQVGGLALDMDLSGTPAERWSDREWLEFGIEPPR